VFSNSTATITVATNASGVAAAPFTANAIAGGYNVAASMVAVVTPVMFSLTNTTVVAAVNVPTLSNWGLLTLSLLLLISSRYSIGIGVPSTKWPKRTSRRNIPM
jgi:hypothetical protein